MSTEYHHRVFNGRRSSWRVERLRALASDLQVETVAVAEVWEFAEVYWFDEEHRPTCRAVVEHAERIAAADLTDPILLSADGWMVDGMHRVARAVMEGVARLPGRRLERYPEPDDVQPA